jgi:2-keto-4-pentenoate hydratase/2-oxohepta-3-ene-1,7-dioic acid hydratase in catechol pathway
VRIARFAAPGGDVSFGVVEGPGEDPADLVVAAVAGHPFAPFTFTGERFPLSQVRLLAPVLPSKVVCIGKNYADHIAEMGLSTGEDPIVFLKPSTSVVGPGDPVVLPRNSSRVDHEAELAVVVGRLCREVPRERALEVVLGYTCGNDVTARDHQAADKQWTRGKSHDTFCPLGPWIETDLDVSDVVVQARVDGELKQDGRTSQLIHDVPAVIEWVTAFMTLLPGDVILTGTPAGVGPITAGQTVSVTVGGVGTLTNPVVAPR